MARRLLKNLDEVSPENEHLIVVGPQMLLEILSLWRSLGLQENRNVKDARRERMFGFLSAVF